MHADGGEGKIQMVSGMNQKARIQGYFRSVALCSAVLLADEVADDLMVLGCRAKTGASRRMEIRKASNPANLKSAVSLVQPKSCIF